MRRPDAVEDFVIAAPPRGDDAGPVSPTRAQEITYLNGLNPDGTLATGSASYWSNSGRTARRWGNSSGTTTLGTGATITYAFDSASGFSGTEQTTVLRAFDMWSSVADVTFTAASSQGVADVVIRRGASGSGAYESNTTTTVGGGLPARSSAAIINIETGATGFDLSGNLNIVGGYGQSTIIHEVGHLLGLGHGGSYNGSVNPATQQYSAYDERLWTTMSYIYWRQTNGQYAGSYPVTGTDWGTSPDNYYRQAPHTVMQLDIQAIQQLYGVSTTATFAGGQTYGFHSNITGRLALQYDFTQNTAPVVTLYNRGLNNTLDLSGFSQAATVNLNDGAFSSFAGLTNNLSIAVGTRIDNFVGGSGTNNVTGNAYANVFTITTGTCTIDGGGGIDTVAYNVARSAVAVTRNSNGTYTVAGSGYNDTLTSIERLRFTDRVVALGAAVRGDLNGDGTSDLILQSGSTVSDWILGNGAYQSGNVLANSGGFSVVGRGDVNGDGTTDIILQGGGTVVDWIMNNGRYQSGNTVTAGGAAGYTVRAVGDFDGDGTADLVLQSGDTVVRWRMQNGAYAGGGVLASAAGFTVVGAGDFDGDGTSDLLLQNGGTVVQWRMQNGNYAGGGVLANAAGYTVVGTGDFNGNGTDDVLLQAGGTVVDWIMAGGRYQSGNVVTTGAGDFGVRTTGDYNGDGTTDIVLQAGTGTVVQWRMQNGLYAGGGVLANGSGYAVVG